MIADTAVESNARFLYYDRDREAAKEAEDVIGKQIAQYKILAQLGEGGMGVVYKAEDAKLHRTVALKFLSSETVATENDKKRFTDEARAAAALDHPNICTVYEINEYQGQSFIAMAYVEGRSLREEIDEGPIDLVQAVDYAVQIAKGLAAAHEKGIVHRDIKSANIMVTRKGDVKITDFGIAHRAGAVTPADDGTTVGTLAYSPPEQLRGDEVDHRSDIWSFGVTLYEVVTGRLPFHGDYRSAAAYSIQNESPPSPRDIRPDVPEALEAIILRALSKDPDDRYQSADDMQADLRKVQIALDPTISQVLSGMGSDAGVSAQPWYRRLFSGRLIGAVGVYLIFVFFAAQFTGWLVSRFVWSPYLESLVVTALLLLLPAVVLIAFSISDGAFRRAAFARNVGVPLNLVLALGLIYALYSERDLGAATTTVAVTDEEGNTIERTVPKDEFRKKITVFFLDNETGDSTNVWVHYATHIMLNMDLYQDPFIIQRSAFEPTALNRLKRAGFQDWRDVPVVLLQKIARELYTDYFLTGSYSVDNGYRVRTELYEVQTGKLVAEHALQNENLFELVDDMSVQLRRDLDIPEGHIEQSSDLPVAELLTRSEQAMKEFALGRAKHLLENDSDASVEFTKRAVAADSTFTMAYFILYVLYRLDNQADKAEAAIDKVMTHLYKLPERLQYLVKSVYYDFKQDPTRQLAVLEMLVELYPDDLQSRATLANAYVYRNEMDKAIEQMELILEYDPYNFEYVGMLVDLYANSAKFEEAQRALDAYTEFQPDDPAALIKSGELYESQGDLKAARGRYDRALIIDPANAEVLSKLGHVETKGGHFADARSHYDEALRVAKTAQDKFQIYDELVDYYEMRGQSAKALEANERALAQAQQFLPPLQVQFVRLGTLDRYIRAGRTERAFSLLDSVSALIAPPLDKLAKIGDVDMYLALEQSDKAANVLVDLEEAVNAMQLHVLDSHVMRARGDIAVLEGDFEAGIAHYREQLAVDPADTRIYREIGKCQRSLGQYHEAEQSILKRLATHPMDPKAHYQMALIFAETGNMSKALEHLKKALEVWEEADSNYEPAIKARKKLEEWRRTTSM